MLAWFRRKFDTFAIRLIEKHLLRKPDLVIRGHVQDEIPYLVRWYLHGHYVTPKGKKRANTLLFHRFFLHCFSRSDDDRAHHDHPSYSISIGLFGGATEETIERGGIIKRRQLGPLSIRFRSAKFAHRMVIEPGKKFWTIFIFGPDLREWGFHCKDGWRPHYEFDQHGCD